MNATVDFRAVLDSLTGRASGSGKERGGGSCRGNSTMARPSDIVRRARQHVRSAHKAVAKFGRPQAFSTPADAEAAAVRAVRNLAHFRVHYAVMQWTILLLVLAPTRPATVFFLMADSKAAALYLALHAAFPNSAVLRKVLHRKIVFGLLLLVAVAQLALAHAVGHLLSSLAVGTPAIFCHALFRSRDDLSLPDSDSDSDEHGTDDPHNIHLHPFV